VTQLSAVTKLFSLVVLFLIENVNKNNLISTLENYNNLKNQINATITVY